MDKQLDQMRRFAALMGGEPDAFEDFEDWYKEDYHTCDCEVVSVHRGWYGALGLGREIRLCCMAKALEKALDLPEGTFYRAVQFSPLFVWDCDAEVDVTVTEPDENGSPVPVLKKQKLGPPPKFMQERAKRYGIPILNLPEE